MGLPSTYGTPLGGFKTDDKAIQKGGPYFTARYELFASTGSK